ncbi:MAG: hypothetical protein PHS32_06100 [Rhodoferax sp.]|uniref:hypothetical protein n=1 Tax=Rhodoferax sp. TaxID=50421 RepID=UPI0026370E6C|nr:hypothetical protein [Rhodoferax sp.]MDD5333303.1 hypothetical protein [Rhodoferax sp.]
MHDIKWTHSEQKTARKVFDAALQRELAAILSKLKELAASAKTPQDMWEIEKYLTQQRRQIDSKYDFRYSQLIEVFGRLLRENWIEEKELQALSPEKLAWIQHIATL